LRKKKKLRKMGGGKKKVEEMYEGHRRGKRDRKR